MRKLVFTLLMLLTLSLNAQDKDVVKFMGIPVDGSKSEMISKLEGKGFNPTSEVLEIENMERQLLSNGEKLNGVRFRESDGLYPMQGYFDGHSCNLFISSYNNKVYQIMVTIDSPYNELEGKITFNSYVDKLGKKYTNPLNLDFSIDIETDLSEPYDNNIRAFFTTAYDEHDKPHGAVCLEMSHPRNKEFYIAFRYYNADNMPNGEDL